MSISPRASPIGLPALRASIWARSSRCSRTASDTALSSAARSDGDSARHAGYFGAGPLHGGIDVIGAGARDLLQNRLGGGLQNLQNLQNLRGLATDRLRQLPAQVR